MAAEGNIHMHHVFNHSHHFHMVVAIVAVGVALLECLKINRILIVHVADMRVKVAFMTANAAE
jgi:hypothetical protein